MAPSVIQAAPLPLHRSVMPVLARVMLARLVGVMLGVRFMTLCHLRVMTGCLMVATFVVVGRRLMMLGGMLVMFCGFAVMFRGLL